MKSALAWKSVGVALGGLHVGDVAEELDGALGALGPGAAGHPDPAAPGALREPVELAVGAHALGQLGELVAGRAERRRQALGEAPVGNPLLGAVGDEARDRSRIRRHGGASLFAAASRAGRPRRARAGRC